MLKKSSSSVQIFYPRFNKHELVQTISKSLINLKIQLPLSLVILFGSYAKGNYTAASDIDLLVVYQGKERKDAYAVVKKTLDIPNLEPHVYAEIQFEEMKDTIKMMTKDGITLYPP